MNKKILTSLALVFMIWLPIVAGSLENTSKARTSMELCLGYNQELSEDCLDELILLMHFESLANDCANDPGCSGAELDFLDRLVLDLEQALFDCIDPI
jgi:hypothetical protein